MEKMEQVVCPVRAVEVNVPLSWTWRYCRGRPFGGTYFCLSQRMNRDIAGTGSACSHTNCEPPASLKRARTLSVCSLSLAALKSHAESAANCGSRKLSGPSSRASPSAIGREGVAKAAPLFSSMVCPPQFACIEKVMKCARYNAMRLRRGSQSEMQCEDSSTPAPRKIEQARGRVSSSVSARRSSISIFAPIDRDDG